MKPALSTPRFHRPSRSRSLIGMGGFILALHLVGWGALLLTPTAFTVGGSLVYGIGLGLTAYTLGMRHAFDADHIAAIDNATRKLQAEGQRPVSVGFWFSLGHSTIVFALVAVLALGIQAVGGQLADDASILRQVTQVFGTAVSGSFLVLIGVVNLVVLFGIIGVIRRMRRGAFDEQALERQLDGRGLINRLVPGATRAVDRPGRMYPVGLLFGLGFDTATEVGLLVLAGSAAAFALPWYLILTLPILFAAGMSLLDTVDGVLMNQVYGWALARPVRKVYYNLVVTALSVAVALIIGGIELTSILTEKLGIDSGPLAAIGAVDLDGVGFVIVGIFAFTWLTAVIVWRLARIEDRWSEHLAADRSAR